MMYLTTETLGLVCTLCCLSPCYGFGGILVCKKEFLLEACICLDSLSAKRHRVC